MLRTLENRIFKKQPCVPEALRHLQSAIGSAADKLVETLPGQSEHIRSRLVALVSSLDQDAATVDLNAIGREFDVILDDYQSTEHELLFKQEQTLCETIEVLTRVRRDLTTGQSKHSAEMAALICGVELAGESEASKTVRQALAAQATNLYASLQALERDRVRIEADLSRHISYLEKRLGDIKGLASEDPLTGLTNRREAEAELLRHQAEYAVFTILFVGIRNLDVVNYTCGRAAGDQLLRLFAARLKTLTKPSETVYRWGGQEFLIVLKSSLPRARARSAELQDPLSIPFALDSRNGLVKVSAENLIGVAEYCTGDCIDDLVARAHTDMHQHNPKSLALPFEAGRA